MIVGFHRQHVFGKTHWGDLLEFVPPTNFTIKATGYNEQGKFWEHSPTRLDKFINDLIITNVKFQTVKDWFKETEK